MVLILAHKNVYITNMTLEDVEKGERIAKRLARAGVCSRREAERWIAEGRVMLNDKILETPAINVMENDRILVDGKPIAGKEPARLWRYHKPEGLVTSHSDEKGRRTIFDSLPKGLPRVISVGRLDLNSEGLLLLTNDGELSRYLEMPATGWLRKYRVRAHGRTTQAKLDTLKDGIHIDGITYGPIEAVMEKSDSANVWIDVSLKEGKNREVRKVLDALGLTVNRLIRIAYGPFMLGDLAVGAVKEISVKEFREVFGEKFS
jgi:23S rRNA pseudouridine2605 synthase